MIEALPYIQKFRGAVIVVKFGGSAMEDKERMLQILQDIAFMECAGMKPVIVHGGGKAISRGMEAHGIKSSFLQGLRVTCEKTIEVVEKVIKGEVNPKIVEILKNMGADAVSAHGEDVFKVTRKTATDKESGEKLDWGFVGEPDDVATGPIDELLKMNRIPVVTPLGTGPDGRVHNINADTAAAAMAKALKAEKLVFVSDVPGILRNTEDEGSLLPTIRAAEAPLLEKEGVISGGMLPKVESALQALKAGVGKVHMIDGRIPHCLLLEIFTDKGVGTQLVHDDD